MYACHFSHDGDQVYLPCSLIGTGNACNIFKIENSLPVKHVNFRSNLIEGNERCCQKMDFNLEIWQALPAPITEDGRYA